MEKINFKEMSAEELTRQIEELRKTKFVLRTQQKSGQLESPAKIRQARKDLARALTEQKARSASKSATA